MTTATDPSFYTVDVAQLRVGSKLQVPIFDESDILLLADGQVVTSNFLEKLRNRSIGQVKVHQAELPRILAGQPVGTAETVPPPREGLVSSEENDVTRRLDEATGRPEELQLGPQGEPFADRLVEHGDSRYDVERRNDAIAKREKSIEGVRSIFEQLNAGHRFDVAVLSDIADEALEELQSDSDLFGSLGVNPLSAGYPARHSMHVCMLALSIGTTLKLDHPTLRDLAVGCLVHDAGMLQIDPRSYENGKRIGHAEFSEIAKHPVLLFEKLADVPAVSKRSAMIAYQIHERCDGSGYPRRRTSSQMHFLSKVAAVADAFVGLVAPRPYREALQPYHAVKHLLQETAAGRFDPTATRALLNAVSMFPVGSFVQLDDGRVGQTLRANGEQYDRPTVEVWDPSDASVEPVIVNLTEERDRHVVSVLPKLEFEPEVEF